MRHRLTLLLRWGGVIAALPVLAGGLILLAGNGIEPVDFATFSAMAPAFRLGDVLVGAMAGSGADLVRFGVLILVLLQLARAALTGLVFAQERDWMYAGLSALVLCALTIALVVSGVLDL